MSGDRPWTPEEVAAFFSVSEGTLRQWRYLGKGPAWRKVGGLVRYDRTEVMRYWDEDCAA